MQEHITKSFFFWYAAVIYFQQNLCKWHYQNSRTLTSCRQLIFIYCNALKLWSVNIWQIELTKFKPTTRFLLLIKHDDDLHHISIPREEITEISFCKIWGQATKENLWPVQSISLLLLHATRIACLGINLVDEKYNLIWQRQISPETKV